METIFKKFIKYISLNILGMLSIAFCIFIDTFFISKAMGIYGLTALNLVIPIYSIINGIGHMLGIGGGARYGSLKAQGEKKEANRVFTLSLLMGIFFSVVCILIGFFLTQQLSLLLGAEGHILTMTTPYLNTILILSPGLILSNLFAGFIRNDGAPKVAMCATIILSVTNIVLDYIFIFSFGWGMFGAAFATMIGSLLSFFFLLGYWLKKKTNFHFVKTKFTGNQLKEIISTGAPAFIGEISSAVVITVFNLVILNLKGNVGVAAYGVVANLAFVVIAIFMGLGQGVQPLVSEFFGKGDRKGLKKVIQYALRTVFILASLIYGIVFLFADSMIAIFNSEHDLILAGIAHQAILIYFTGFIFVGINIVSIIFLSVTTAPKSAALLSLLRGGVIIVPTVLLFSRNLGIEGVWLSYPVSELLVTFVAVFCLKKIKHLNI